MKDNVLFSNDDLKKLPIGFQNFKEFNLDINELKTKILKPVKLEIYKTDFYTTHVLYKPISKII